MASEALGTAIIILFGTGSVAMTVAALSQSGRGKVGLEAAGDWLLITAGWGLGVAFAVWVAGGVSGAHLNPAVTLARALRRGFPWSKVPSYWAAQAFGAIVGAAIIDLNDHDAISSFEHAQKIVRGTKDSIPTFSIFATFPAPYARPWPHRRGHRRLLRRQRRLRDQPRARPRPTAARLGRGWKSVAIPGDYGNVNFLMCVPIVGPLVGGALGAYVYDLLIRDVLIARGATPDPEIADEGRTAIEEPGGVTQ